MPPLPERAEMLIRFLRRSRKPTVNPSFHLRCPAGHELHGVRLSRWYQVRCPECDRAVVVFPASPFPPPASPPRPRPQPDKVKKRAQLPRLRVRLRRGRRQAVRQLRQRVAQLKPPRRWFSRRRLIFAGVAVFLVATVFLTVWRTGRDRLRATLDSTWGPGIAAFESGDFNKADNALSDAATAVENLGLAQERWEVLQAAREASLCADLVSTRLDQIARQALADTRSQGAGGWQRSFRTLYQGKAIVFDGLIFPKTYPDRVRYDLDFLLVEDGNRFQLDGADLELFQRLAPTKPQRVIFGARLAAVEPTADGKRWSIQLASDSGMLFTRAAVLARLGWSVDAELESTLASQRTWLEEHK